MLGSHRLTNRRPRIEHRTKLATSGPMPPELAQRFTLAELAVMKIVADEVARLGTCRLTKGEMSDRAKTSESTVHNAIRKARDLDLLTVQQRRQPGRKNLPNLIIITDKEWWLCRPKYRALRQDREEVKRNFAKT